jgi:capsular exopolysaccharide synthesis family protein
MDSFKTPPPQETKLHFLDYWRIVRIRKAIIITVFLITAIIATAVTFILPESYASTVRLIVNSDISDISGLSGERGVSEASYDPYFLQTTFELIQSQVVLSNVVNAMNLNVEWGKKYFSGQTLKTTESIGLLKQRLSLSTVRNTKYITITIYSEDKNAAARLANAIAEAYQDYRLKQRQELTARSIDVLETQFQEDEEQIQDVQTNVDRLRRVLNIYDSDANSINPTPTLTQEVLQRYHEQQIEGEKTYKQLETRLTELQGLSTDKLRDVLPSVSADGALSDLLSKLHEAQQKLVVLTNDYSPTNLMVARVQSLVDELNRQIDDRVAGVMAGIESSVESQKAALDAFTAAVEDAKTKDQQEAIRGQPYWEEKRKLGRMLDFHRALAAKIESEKLSLEIPKTAMVQITDPAEPGRDPVKPNKTLNITLGLVFGLIMGVGLAFFIEYLDTSVKTIDDVERAFQAPVLGVIPQNVGILVDEGSESKHAEAYSVLRTNLLFSRKDDKLNSVVVVSAGAGEGKTTTALNLATVFAHTGQRVLLVDSDLRRPTLHKLLHVSNSIGLTNYLLKQNSLAEVIQNTSVPLLHFMASGKLPNSSMGILGSSPMKDMIAELKQRYDFIFYDSPPILGVSDASILASEVDLVLQVIEYRRYPQPMNVRGKQMIEKVGGNFAGIVLNNINMSQDESYYYYSGYYHDYYNSHREGEQPAVTQGQTTPGDTGQTEIKQKY